MKFGGQNRLDCLVLGAHDPRILTGSIERADVNRRLTSPTALSSVDLALRSNEAYQNIRIGDEFMGPTVALSHLRWEAATSDRMPLYTEWELPMPAILLLVTYLSRAGLNAKGINFLTAQPESLLEELNRGPRMIAVTTTYYTVPFAGAQITQFIKQLVPEIPVVLGGPLIDNMTRQYGPETLQGLFDIIGADHYVVEGEGEKTLATLVRNTKEGRDPAQGVANVYSWNGDEWALSRREVENNPVEESTVDWDLFPPDFAIPTINIRTARSCAFRCAFCDFPLRFPKLSSQPVEVVESEIRKLVDRGSRHIIFIDDTFNVPTGRFDEILKMIIRNNFDIEWYSFFRLAVTRSEETYRLMSESGCGGVFLGLESGDPTVLRNMNKLVGMDRLRFGLEQLNRYGILCDAGLMTGFPGETEETIENTVRFINETAPTFYANQIWFYAPNTPVGKKAEEYDLSGFGYSWKHRTMTSEQALKGVEYSRDRIRNSRVTTAGNPGFWMVPYLRGKGMSREEILTFHDLLGEGFRYNQLSGENKVPYASYDEYVLRFKRFARQLKLSEPAYHLDVNDSPFVSRSYLETMENVRQRIETLSGERAGR